MVEQALPWCLTGLAAFGQVEAYFPCAGSYPSRDGDEFAANRAGPCLIEGPGREDPGGAGEVVGHERGDLPCRVRSENAGGHVGQRAVLQIGIDLLDLRMLAVGFFRRDGARSSAPRWSAIAQSTTMRVAQIDDSGHVEPAFTGAQVRDGPDQTGSRGGGTEIPPDEVNEDILRVRGNRRALERPRPLRCRDLRRDDRHSSRRHLDAGGGKFRMDHTVPENPVGGNRR